MDQQLLKRIEIPLEELSTSTRGIRGCLLATADGVAVLHRNLDDQSEALAALSASSLGIGRRVAEVGGCGALQEVCFKGFEGWVSVVAVGNRAVLAAVAFEGCSIGMVMYYSRKYADEILGILDPEQARLLEEREDTRDEGDDQVSMRSALQALASLDQYNTPPADDDDPLYRDAEKYRSMQEPVGDR
ncbi:MAG: roadblock/LC7 domain-containing protein [Bryobacterales bacterium]|nr:roadblock/LC7 domain-containing protein [Bryobacterales bacterium]